MSQSHCLLSSQLDASFRHPSDFLTSHNAGLDYLLVSIAKVRNIRTINSKHMFPLVELGLIRFIPPFTIYRTTLI